MAEELDTLRAHIGDRYEIERELGGGGMSRVFVATERALARRVVVKVLAPELAQRVNLERFQQEIATAATLQHPQIVPVYHAGAAGELRYYVMPFVAGESLRERLRRDGRLGATDTIRLLAPLARALAYAHRENVVHRDVKPENILLAEGEPMLADFGIAKVVRGTGSQSGLTSAGMSIGTVTYMPPEQVAADPNIDGRADVYSLAAVGYELLTGAPPFAGTPAEVMAAHVVQPVPSLAERAPEAPPALVAALMAGLEKSPEARPDAERFAFLLEESGRTVSSERPSTHTMQGLRTHRRRRMAAGAGIALVLGLGLTSRWWWPVPPEAGAAEREPSIAVLPFEMIGPAEDGYLAAGVTEEIMTELGQVAGIRVLSRATTRSLADSNFSPEEYGSRMGVRALIEGSVQRAGTQLRVSARLVDTRDGNAMWSDRYERTVVDLFRTQQEISRAVTAALSERLQLAGREAASASSSSVDPVAYDLFLRGRFALRERGEDGIRRASALFVSAATRDPGFARAHAGIAEAAALLPIYSTVTRASVADTLRASAARALALDSTLATPHVALGLLEKGLGRWSEGEAALRRALSLDPNDAAVHQNLGELYFALGRVTESREALARAAALEPTQGTILSEFAYALLLAGETDSAVRVVARAALAEPGSPYVAYTQSVVAERMGDRPTAARRMEAAADAAPLPFFRGALARAQWLAGDTAAARRTRASLEALGESPGATFGRVIASLPDGDADALFRGVEEAIAEGDPFVFLLPLRVWWYDRLRPDARFAGLAARMGLPPSSTAALEPPRR